MWCLLHSVKAVSYLDLDLDDWQLYGIFITDKLKRESTNQRHLRRYPIRTKKMDCFGNKL